MAVWWQCSRNLGNLSQRVAGLMGLHGVLNHLQPLWCKCPATRKSRTTVLKLTEWQTNRGRKTYLKRLEKNKETWRSVWKDTFLNHYQHLKICLTNFSGLVQLWHNNTELERANLSSQWASLHLSHSSDTVGIIEFFLLVADGSQTSNRFSVNLKLGDDRREG